MARIEQLVFAKLSAVLIKAQNDAAASHGVTDTGPTRIDWQRVTAFHHPDLENICAHLKGLQRYIGKTLTDQQANEAQIHMTLDLLYIFCRPAIANASNATIKDSFLSGLEVMLPSEDNIAHIACRASHINAATVVTNMERVSQLSRHNRFSEENFGKALPHHLAIQNQDLELIKMIEESGVVNKKQLYQDVISYAVINNCTELLMFAIRRGGAYWGETVTATDFNDTLLDDFNHPQSKGLLQHFVQACGTPALPQSYWTKIPTTLMLKASYREDFNVIDYLFQMGADLKNDQGYKENLFSIVFKLKGEDRGIEMMLKIVNLCPTPNLRQHYLDSALFNIVLMNIHTPIAQLMAHGANPEKQFGRHGSCMTRILKTQRPSHAMPMIDLLTSSLPVLQRKEACQRLLFHAARQNLVNMVAPLIDQFALDPLAMDEVGITFMDLAFKNQGSTRQLITQAANSYKPTDGQRKTFLDQALGYAINHGRASDPSGTYDALCIDLIRFGAMPDPYCQRAFEDKRYDKIVRAAAALNDTDKMTVLNDHLVQAVYANQTAKGNYQHKHRRQLIEELIRAGANPLYDQFIQAACTNTNSIGLIISASKAASHQHGLDDRVKDTALRYLLEQCVKLTPTQLRNQTAQLLKNDASLTRNSVNHHNGVDRLIANGTFETVVARIKQTNVEVPVLEMEEEGLRSAARAGNVGLAATLLQQQVNPLLIDNIAKNYLAYAVGHSDPKRGYQLVEAALDARPLERDVLLNTALWAFPNFGAPALVTTLIRAGADISSPPQAAIVSAPPYCSMIRPLP